MQASGVNKPIEIIGRKPMGKTWGKMGVTRESAGSSGHKPGRTPRFSGNTNSLIHNIRNFFYKTNSNLFKISYIFFNTNFKPATIRPPEGISGIEKIITRNTYILIQLKIYIGRIGKTVNEQIPSGSRNRATLNEIIRIVYRE